MAPSSRNNGLTKPLPCAFGAEGGATVRALWEDGNGQLTMTTSEWTIGGEEVTDILGKSIIVHAGQDDFTTQPTGAAGGRIGCAVIEAREAALEEEAGD